MEQKTIQFDGAEDKYIVKIYSTFKGMQIQTKLLTLLSGIVPLLIAGEEIHPEDIAGIFERGFFKDEEAFQKFIVKILEGDVVYVSGEGKEQRIDSNFINTHFRGKYVEMYKLVIEVLKFQFADFFESGLLGKAV